MQVGASVDMHDVDAMFGSIEQHIDNTLHQVIQLGKEAKRLVTARTPRKTGRLARGWQRIDYGFLGFEVVHESQIVDFLEYGTRPHIIVPVIANALHWVDEESGDDVFARRVRHPGTKPLGFVRRTQNDVEKIGETIVRQFDRVVSRL
jgi:hypothetical protein